MQGDQAGGDMGTAPRRVSRQQAGASASVWPWGSLVQEGFYSNRTDFIRTAIRNQIERHAEATKQTVARKSVELGLRHYGRDDLEAARSAGQTLHIRVLGLVSIAQDVTPELARATIASIEVLGALHASAAVKAALRDRMR